MPDPPWSLHPQLAADTMPVGDLALSRLLAINAADYPWLILVPRRTGVVELADLGSDAFPLMAEIGVVSLALKLADTRRSAMWCRSCTFISSRAGKPIRSGRSRCSA